MIVATLSGRQQPRDHTQDPMGRLLWPLLLLMAKKVSADDLTLLTTRSGMEGG